MLQRTTANSADKPAAQLLHLKLNSSLTLCSDPILHETKIKAVEVDGMHSGLI